METGKQVIETALRRADARGSQRQGPSQVQCHDQPPHVHDSLLGIAPNAIPPFAAAAGQHGHGHLHNPV